VRTEVSEEIVASIIRVERFSKLADFFHLDDGGDTFLRNVCSYKSRTASHPRRRHSSQQLVDLIEIIQYDSLT
jgi:hypothetical protein